MLEERKKRRKNEESKKKLYIRQQWKHEKNGEVCLHIHRLLLSLNLHSLDRTYPQAGQRDTATPLAPSLALALEPS